MKVRNKNLFSGETLIEVMIAVSILMIIIGPAGALYTSSMSNTAHNRNDLVAVGLVEEGLEVARNMRDTNLLRYSDRVDECWNTKLNLDAGHDCAEDTQKIGYPELASGMPKYYVLKFDFSTFDDSLSDAGITIPLNLQTDEGSASVYKLRSDVATPSEPECAESDGPADCVFHTGIYFSPATVSAATRGTESMFYRQITIQYLPTLALAGEQRAMKVTSIVQYRIGGSVRTLKRWAILTSNPRLQ